MNNRFTDRLGFVTGALTTLSFMPQVYQVWASKPIPATAISLPMYIIFVVGISGWLVYGVRIKSTPVVVWNAITLVLAASVLAYKLMYG